MNLRRSEKRYRSVIDNLDEGYVEIDSSGVITYANRAAILILEKSQKSPVGTEFYRFLDPAEHTQFKQAITRQSVPKVNPKVVELSLKKSPKRPLCTVKCSIFHDADTPSECGLLLKDLGRRKREASPQNAKTDAETASQHESRFLAKMSHEIRTPLNAIIGLVELLQTRPHARETLEDLAVVQSAAYSLLTLINGILDFSKIEAGKLELAATKFSLREHIGETLRIIASQCHEKGVEICWNAQPDIPDLLIGDAMRLRQVLLNLIDNAVKFTHEGRITVSVKHESGSKSDPVLLFAVKDTGIGVATEKQEIIFRSFTQASEKMAVNSGGTGLGLTISRQIVNLMGGRIWIESKPHRGSTFFFTARFASLPQPEKIESFPDQAATRNLKTMIVDCQAHRRRALSEILDRWGIPYQSAGSTETALFRIQEAQQSGSPYRLLLIDTSMPGEACFDTAQRLAGASEPMPHIILILPYSTARYKPLTGHLKQAVRIFRPLHYPELSNALKYLLDDCREPNHAPNCTQVPTTPIRDPAPLRILLAEDTRLNQHFILRLLKHWNHKATVAQNGHEVLDLMETGTFDLILMDVEMPEMDGISVTRVIRGKEMQTDFHIPIIAMTAHALKGDRERCLTAGMDDYIAKPFRPEALRSAIGRLCRSQSEVCAQSPCKDSQKLSLIDTGGLLSAFDHDREFLKEALEIFRTDTPPLLDKIEQGLAAGDAENVRRNAHALRGMLGNFFAQSAAREALAVEMAARDHDVDGARAKFESLAQATLAVGKILIKLADKNTKPTKENE